MTAEAAIIREARADDAAAIIAIYAPYVEGGVTSFELTVPDPAEMRRRIAENGRYGWYVHEEGGRVTGYAYASKQRDRAAYRWNCEVSVYVAAHRQRAGIAAGLYRRLFERLRERGLINAYAGITLPNEGSVRFHEAQGFRSVGVYRRVGYKSGGWHDVGWWAIRLQDPPGEPAPPRLG